MAQANGWSWIKWKKRAEDDKKVSFREMCLDALCERPRYNRRYVASEGFFFFFSLMKRGNNNRCRWFVSFVIEQSIYWFRLIDNSAEIMNNNGSLLIILSPMTDVSIRRQASNGDINSRSKWVKNDGKNWIVLREELRTRASSYRISWIAMRMAGRIINDAAVQSVSLFSRRKATVTLRLPGKQNHCALE